MSAEDERGEMLARTANQGRLSIFNTLMTLGYMNFGNEIGDCSGLIQGGMLGVIDFALNSAETPEVLEARLREMFEILLPQAIMRRREHDLGAATEAGHA